METKSYKDIGNIPVMFQEEEILDRVVELHGQFKNRGQIREILTKELELEKPISFVIIDILISRAKAFIREQLKIKEPQEYKGRIIYCLELILGGKTKPRDRLKALEMLATYTGVETQVQEDPSDYAKRVCQAMKEADFSVDGIPRLESKDEPQEHDKQAEGTRQEEREGETQTPKVSSQADEM